MIESRGQNKKEHKRTRRETRGRWMIDDGRKTKRINSVRELKVYRLAFDKAMEIYNISKDFPKEERYSLTDQIRRSSRSVCANLAEGCFRPRGAE